MSERNSSGIRDLPVVGGMASIPSRAATLGPVLDKIMPQVERLHLFLHGYADVPPAAQRAGVLTYLAGKDHPYRASGKFFGLSQESEPCLYCCFDDDIYYRRGYVRRLRRGLMAHGDRAVVGFHSIVFDKAGDGYRAQRRQVFWHGSLRDIRVDALGTGTIAFRSDLMPIDVTAWQYGDMDDLMLAQDLARQNIPMISLSRLPGLLFPAIRAQSDSLFYSMKQDSSRHDAEMRRLIDIRKAVSQS